MLIEKTINKIILETLFNMKVLKKKTLGIFEVYLIFLSFIFEVKLHISKISFRETGPLFSKKGFLNINLD